MRDLCPRWDVQDVMAPRWSTSIKRHSPPRGRYVHSSINERNTYFWVIEGDIHAACESMHQATLHKLLAQRIADQRLLDVIDRFLKAGMMQGELFLRTEIGTPQGAIGSPGLATISLHQMALYGWTHSGSLARQVKERRRPAYQGHCALLS